MVGQLRDLIGSLETRVQARTAQLTAGAQVARATPQFSTRKSCYKLQ